MNTLAVIHHIEDLQVVCFAVVFGIMAAQARRDRTFRFLLVSYLLGSVVSLTDVTLEPSPTLSAVNLALISLRYGAMTFALAAFVQVRSWFARLALCLSALAVIGVGLAATRTPMRVVLPLDYATLAAQFLLLAAMLLSSKESATRTPRTLLAVLFGFSVAIRCCLIVAVVRPTAGTAWLMDQLWFINSTLVGCMVPFTIIWMMNSRVYANLRKQSVMDPLTGLLNRRGLQQAVTREMARFTRSGQNFAVAVADIDHFKQFNDTHGHSCGDRMLQAFAEIAESTLRQTDIIARTGGEEFTMLLAFTSEEEMGAILDRVRLRGAENPIQAPSSEALYCKVSIGVTNTRSRPEVTWQTLLKEADTALYQAKRAGRNRTMHYGQMDGEESAGLLHEWPKTDAAKPAVSALRA